MNSPFKNKIAESSAFSIHEYIKVETALLHRNVEKQLSSILFSHHLRPESYLCILLSMERSYEVMENTLNSYLVTQRLLAQRSKLAWLKSDINYLKTKVQLNSAQVKDPIHPLVCNSAEAMGMLYVMEGATMGGSHIQRALKKYDWLSHKGLEFFFSYGDKRQQKWYDFLVELDHFYHITPDSKNEILNGAKLAFEIMSSAFDEMTINAQ